MYMSNIWWTMTNENESLPSQDMYAIFCKIVINLRSVVFSNCTVLVIYTFHFIRKLHIGLKIDYFTYNYIWISMKIIKVKKYKTCHWSMFLFLYTIQFFKNGNFFPRIVWNAIKVFLGLIHLPTSRQIDRWLDWV